MLLSFFKKHLSFSKAVSAQPDPARYEAERKMAASTNVRDRLRLARDPRTHLEILYYLASDDDHDVRLAVAQNQSTPMQASPTIATDKDLDIRLALAKRLMAILPDLSNEQHTQLYAFAVQALGVLALDEVLKVRLALSSVLKDKAYAPPEVVSKLARDIERTVSEPILRYCVALPDSDLLDILSEHPKDWVLEAIANRQTLSEPISDAIINENQPAATAALLANNGALISDQSLQTIITQAPELPEWHKPLVLRKHLPAWLTSEIVRFVDVSLHRFILERTDYDEETRAEIEDTIKRRMRFLVDESGNRIAPKDKVIALHKSNQLDEAVMQDALALREYDFIRMGLALKAKIPMNIVMRILNTRAAKAITALTWKAGYSMRYAFSLQRDLARVPHSELIYPRGGEDYPMTPEEMEWQINFFMPDKT